MILSHLGQSTHMEHHSKFQTLMNQASAHPEKLMDKHFVKYITEGQSIDGYLSIYQGKLVFQYDDITNWLNLEESHIEAIHSSEHGGGIRVTFQAKELEFFGELEDIVSKTRRFTVQKSFHKKYKLIEKIGKGSQADVFKAINISEQKHYAIKVFSKGKRSNPLGGAPIRKELSILRQMNHPQIVKYYEVFENEEYLFMVTELLNGGELYKSIRKMPPFSEQNCQKIIRQLLQGVLHMHEQGIMHRDLKPQNIILRNVDDFDDICIADFGLAEYHNKYGKYQFTRCGTPGYVAPEILNDKVYDYKVDVYSIGIIMYQLLTGYTPFDAQDYNSIIVKNSQGIIDYYPIKLSSKGLEFMKGMLEINPLQRFSAKKALQHEWMSEQKLSKSCQFKISRNNHMKTSSKTNSPLQQAQLSPIIKSKSPQSCRGSVMSESHSPRENPIKLGAVVIRRSLFRKLDPSQIKGEEI